jgi:hypothetical protein
MSETERPAEIRYGMTQEELNALVEWNHHACHSRRCREPATKVYAKWRANPWGGSSLYRYQRCDNHPVAGAVSVKVYVRVSDGAPQRKDGTT